MLNQAKTEQRLITAKDFAGGLCGGKRKRTAVLKHLGLEARFPARRREERGCGLVTGKDRASCQSGGAPALRPGAVAKIYGFLTVTIIYMFLYYANSNKQVTEKSKGNRYE